MSFLCAFRRRIRVTCWHLLCSVFCVSLRKPESHDAAPMPTPTLRCKACYVKVIEKRLSEKNGHYMIENRGARSAGDASSIGQAFRSTALSPVSSYPNCAGGANPRLFGWKGRSIYRLSDASNRPSSLPIGELLGDLEYRMDQPIVPCGPSLALFVLERLGPMATVV